MRHAHATLVPALLLLGACTASLQRGPAQPPPPRLVDPKATRETLALFANLRRLAGRQVMFGHQDDLAYGVSWRNEPGRSDVKEVAGSYPAVYGWELADLERGKATNIDGVDFARMRGWILDAYHRGGVIALSWHMNNPVSGGNAWDTTRAVASVLPGGARHDEYVRWLDGFADFAASLRGPGPTGDTTLVPLVFRPLHEMSGGWFWWGAPHRTPEDYRALWRFTVEHLRDRRGVHNLLWAYSPNAQADQPRERYWDSYPGDDYVDVLGVDDYSTLQTGAPGGVPPVTAMASQLRWLVEQAEARGKLAALTETGEEGVPDSTWWTGKLLAALKSDSVASRVAWVMVWRNAPRDADHPHHFYAPYPGQPSAADFARFRADPLVVFEDELPDLYRWP